MADIDNIAANMVWIVWARGYYVTTVGNVDDETVRRYIQEKEENEKLEDGRK